MVPMNICDYFVPDRQKKSFEPFFATVAHASTKGDTAGDRETRDNMSLVMRKPVFGVSDQVRHKPGCTTTKDG